MRRAYAAVLLWLVAAAAAQGQTVPVETGAHPGFTRLVLTIGEGGAWRLSRSAAGYSLALAGDRRFDLSRVFQRIGRERLAAVWADPATGRLELSVACACHALPFEFRPGVLVIDLRDGPPPEGSSFEEGADGAPLPPLAARAPVRPRARPPAAAQTPPPPRSLRGYDWLALRRPPPVSASGPPTTAAQAAAIAAPIRGPDFAATRESLMRELARGAARGTVDLALPGMEVPLMRLQGEGPAGVAVADPAARRPRFATGGAACPADDAVDPGLWGDPRPVAQAIGPLTGDLHGEFDRVDSAAAEGAVRYYLHLGFGAEARHLISALPVEGAQTALWLSLARVLEGGIDPAGPLAGMERCPGAAALWAVLADPDPRVTVRADTGALRRAFAAEPAHLRRLLGPRLIARFLEAGDMATAHSLRDAIGRAPGASAESALATAAIDLAAGVPADPAALAPLRAAAGPVAAAATAVTIEAILSQGGTVPGALLVEAEAHLTAWRGTAEEARLRAAVAGARASQGDFAGAFALIARADPQAAPIWAILAERGGDAALLDNAVLAGPGEAPPLPEATRLQLARRLVALGFGGPAEHWLGDAAARDPEARRIAAAAALARGDAQAALRALGGASDAGALRLAAFAMLGSPGALPLATELGDTEAAARAIRRERNWSALASAGEGPWAEAAQAAGPPPDPAAAPPLAGARALLADSAAARGRVTALLSAVPPPAVNPAERSAP